jgi:hypothetical protein
MCACTECRRFSVSGEDTAARAGTCYQAKVVPERPDRFDVLGFKPTDWSGLQLRSYGTYTIRMVPTGIAREGAGAGSRGKELIVDCRVTVSDQPPPAYPIPNVCAHP